MRFVYVLMCGALFIAMCSCTSQPREEIVGDAGIPSGISVPPIETEEEDRETTESLPQDTNTEQSAEEPTTPIEIEEEGGETTEAPSPDTDAGASTETPAEPSDVHEGDADGHGGAAIAIHSVTCSSFVGGAPVRCEVRGRFIEGPGEEIPGLYIQCLQDGSGSPRVDVTDPTLAIVEGCWVCGCGDPSPDACYRAPNAPISFHCRGNDPEYSPHLITRYSDIGTLLSVCTGHECGHADWHTDVCGFSCETSTPAPYVDGCGRCETGGTCTNSGTCDYFAIPETCNGLDDNRDGEVDEALTQPCETACGNGTERCLNGAWVECDAQPELPEICDGLDNDCDEQVDESCPCIVGTYTECGTSRGECEPGIRWCTATDTSSAWEEECIGAVSRTDESCNGLDDDCDGRVDDGFSVGTSCRTPGVCGLGVVECDRTDSSRTICSTGPGGSRYAASTELCDRLDNDCDGSVDEDFQALNTSCTVGVGRCARTGTMVCSGDGRTTQCNASAGNPSNETCNTLDDDCDGQADEDLTNACSTRCGNGIEMCVLGEWRGCTAPPVLVELCNGIDDDCDGVFDEGCHCRVGIFSSCGSDIGECLNGVRECVIVDQGRSSRWGTCEGDAGPIPERCNRLDDDCDGQTDDGFSVGTSCRTPGVCGLGVVECDRTDSSRTICSTGPGGSRYAASTELCDRLDNDCDGSVDEDFQALNTSCTVGVGRCARTGTMVCSGDGRTTQCNASAGNPSNETCNTLDDDCDGQADEDLGDSCCTPSVTRSCGTDVGECISGTQACGSNRSWSTCSDVHPTQERCDGRDDDCDGDTDENFPTLGDECDGPCGIGFVVCDALGGTTRCDATCGEKVIDNVVIDESSPNALTRSCRTCGLLEVTYEVDAASFTANCPGVANIPNVLAVVEDGIHAWEHASGRAFENRILFVPNTIPGTVAEITVRCGDAQQMCGWNQAIGCADGQVAMVERSAPFTIQMLVTTVTHEVGHNLGLPHSNGDCIMGLLGSWCPPCPDQGIMCSQLQDTTTFACSDQDAFLALCGECSECCGCGGVPYTTCTSRQTIERCSDDGCGCHHCVEEPCAAGTTCEGNSCITPCPAGYRDCDGNAGNGCETYGLCGGCPSCRSWNGSACVVVSQETPCASDGNACTTDMCSNGVCMHVPKTCTSPPPSPLCVDGITRRTYASSGACDTTGSCVYPSTDIVCSDGNTCTLDGCSGGSCTFAPRVCLSPPPTTCLNEATLRTYDGVGSCDNGNCIYSFTDTTCTHSCAGSACRSDPCASINCNDGNACTNDQCVNGSCVHNTIANDCGSRVCGQSPSGCFSCGAGCPAGWVCNADGLACRNPNPCPGVCEFNRSEDRLCEDPSPYISYCVFEKSRTCTSSCQWGSWGSCAADQAYARYGVDINTWCSDDPNSSVCITLERCNATQCFGYFSSRRTDGKFTSTDAFWRVYGDDGTFLTDSSTCGSYAEQTRVHFSFPRSRLNLASPSTYRGVHGVFWGGNDCVRNPAYRTGTTWVERCY